MMTIENNVFMEQWAVYNHPLDHPHHWVARKWIIPKAGEPYASKVCFIAGTLEEVRAHIMKEMPGAVKLDRFPQDDWSIHEVWL
jgi:hypothetical protein